MISKLYKVESKVDLTKQTLAKIAKKALDVKLGKSVTLVLIDKLKKFFNKKSSTKHSEIYDKGVERIE